MSLLTAPFRFAEHRADGLARVILPFALLDRLRRRSEPIGDLDPGPDRGPPDAPPTVPDARARADRARAEAAAYLAHRRARLRRDLEARR